MNHVGNTLSNEIAFIDLLEPLRNSDIKNLTVSKTDGHPSKEVHHLAANIIHDKLMNENLLDNKDLQLTI